MWTREQFRSIFRAGGEKGLWWRSDRCVLRHLPPPPVDLPCPGVADLLTGDNKISVISLLPHTSVPLVQSLGSKEQEDYCTVPILYFTVLYCTVLYCTVLYCTVQCWVVLRFLPTGDCVVWRGGRRLSGRAVSAPLTAGLERQQTPAHCEHCEPYGALLLWESNSCLPHSQLITGNWSSSN